MDRFSNQHFAILSAG